MKKFVSLLVLAAFLAVSVPAEARHSHARGGAGGVAVVGAVVALGLVFAIWGLVKWTAIKAAQSVETEQTRANAALAAPTAFGGSGSVTYTATDTSARSPFAEGPADTGTVTIAAKVPEQKAAPAPANAEYGRGGGRAPVVYLGGRGGGYGGGGCRYPGTCPRQQLMIYKPDGSVIYTSR